MRFTVAGNVYLSVKFRAFGVTLGTVSRRWEVALGVANGRVDSVELPFKRPEGATVLMDSRGIFLAVDFSSF